MDRTEYRATDEISDVSIRAPHVVILGAGASLAACLAGDRNGHVLPVMANFVEVVGLEPILKRHGCEYSKGDNFELVYSRLYADRSPAVAEIELAVNDYFSSLELPDKPTIYDHLVLSLREKDFIATFNWDPFLYQACFRNHKLATMPRVAYLHGSVAIGFCLKDRRKGMVHSHCSVCGQKFTRRRLLYPIEKKDYNADDFIKAEWESLKSHLKNAFHLTVFGYSAPQTDIEAIDLMKEAWGSANQREMEQTEIIDIREEDELARNWAPFIHSHHYEVHNSFYDSWIANHPRRTCEAAWQQYYEAKFIDTNPVPRDLDHSDLHKWFGPLMSAEARRGGS